MSNTQIQLGKEYEVVENYGKHFNKGDKLFAYYYGELIIIKNTEWIKYSPSLFIKGIDTGKLQLIE